MYRESKITILYLLSNALLSLLSKEHLPFLSF